MQQMSTADEPEEINTLLPPTQRTLRLLTKTFALWQDTWYHDRRQQELKDLKYYLSKAHIRNHIPKI